ncbi:Uncharacterised protein [Mycobacterium tuberculosis]|uniref:Uncharacterized protein n=1 Tax=Mycobacterium tuberculosis TaxID=1773 RepID=A0A0T9F0C8_MYCTX|nr:Uncharacterised protein [Mycobacterium tuberculosis]CFR71854.1 Uncharacterised protein [Mycobacterium tuberculosis]CKR78701.1 Uncharacterised protein [Mycobacterium tuberculosis]CKR98692.1 Uncharacterised protein [Mycobacterium tuberculosis]CKS11419.1 Uncharacterised protein [Mycobacterium tuberculosis]
MELVDRYTNAVHDVAHDGDHDIGVQGAQQYCQAARANRDSTSCSHADQLTGGFVTWTFSPHFDKVIWTELPEPRSNWACAS